MSGSQKSYFFTIFLASSLATLVPVVLTMWWLLSEIEGPAAEGRVILTGIVIFIAAMVSNAIFAGFVASARAKALAPVLGASNAITGGNLRIRIRSDRDDEIGDLSRAIDDLADSRHRELLESEQRQHELRAILDHAAEGMIVLNDAGRILLINGAARLIFEAAPDAVGRPFEEINRSPAIHTFVQKVRLGSDTVQADVELPGVENTTIRLRGTRIPGQLRVDERILVIASDISDLRRLERMRIDFVANASHELKTPLAAVLGYAETLRDEGDLDPATRVKFLDTIVRNARRLEELVNDLLHLSRLDSHGAAVRFDTIQIDEVCESVVAAHRDAAEKKGVRLVHVASHALLPITAERELVFQCISNLVGNAVKFTPAGGTVTLEIMDVDSGVRIQVSDTGIGISAEHLPRIFERFYRADPARSREAGGTGLGLAIAKHAALLHGGRIEVESTPGKGTRFFVYFPRTPPY